MSEGTDEPKEPTKPVENPQEGNDPAKTDEARFTQGDIDRIVKERLEREKDKAAKAAAKAAEDAKAKALAEQGQHEERARLAEERLAELEPYKERAERMEAVLGKRWEAEKKDVPDYLIPLLEKMPVDERLDYITENRSKWGKPSAPNLNGAGGGKKQEAADEAELRRRFRLPQVST